MDVSIYTDEMTDLQAGLTLLYFESGYGVS